jgi:outer membrane biosynthesis protein TonB
LHFVKSLTIIIHFGTVLHRYRKLNIFTMHYTATMSPSFESEKNQRAFLYTTAVIIALLLIAIFWKWSLPFPPAPIAEDKIEINLGNFDEGMGAVQPLIKGEKTPGNEPAEQQQRQPAAAASNASTDEVQPEEENKEEDAAPVIKPEKIVPKTANTVKQPVTQPVKTTVPVVVPEPKPQKPKIAGYGGPKNGTGNGANETNDYRMQGNKPGGKGDAGDPNGKPDSYGNSPGGKSGGASVTKGVRPYNLGDLRFQDDFNENAKVYVDIRYNTAGTFVSSTISRGTTTSNSKILSIARQKVSALKFPPSDGGGITTILLNFRVQ